MKSRRNRAKNRIEFAAFVSPAVAFVLFAAVVPFFMNLYYSFYEWNGISRNVKFVGMANFVEIFTKDSLFWDSAVFTVKFSIAYVLLSNVISLVIALAVSRQKKSASVGRAFYYIPYIISLTALGLIWKFIFGPGFEALYDLTGWAFFSWSWIGTPKLAFWVVVIMTVWQNVGFYMTTYIAGIIAVPEDVVEAARIDGASRLQVMRKITLPLIAPSIAICTLTSLTFAFKLFDIILVFTKGGPANSTVSVAYNIYKEAFTNNNYGLATAKSLLFFLAVLLVTSLQLRITKAKEVEA